MKQLIFILSTLLMCFVFSCGDQKTIGDFLTESGTDESSATEDNSQTSSDWERMVLRETRDSSGKILAWFPMPESWISPGTNPENIYFEGPGNTTVRLFGSGNYSYYNDPSMRDMAIRSGMEMQPIPSDDSFIENYIKPFLGQNGMTVQNVSLLPEVAKVWQWYMDQMIKPDGGKSVTKSWGIDLIDAQNQKAFLLVNLSETRSPMLQGWFYNGNLLQADASELEKSKKSYLFSCENLKFNIDPIIEFNNQLIQQQQAADARLKQSWILFNQKMADRQMAFDAQQRAHVNKVNSINESIMKGWRSSNQTSDKIQENTVRGIRGTDKVYNTEDGNAYEVQQGYTQYWMNRDGTYIAVESPDYNPNLDESMNGEKWDELRRVE